MKNLPIKTFKLMVLIKI